MADSIQANQPVRKRYAQPTEKETQNLTYVRVLTLLSIRTGDFDDHPSRILAIAQWILCQPTKV